ncbi:nuclear factor erythroid 2-related factor 2-like isoform X2 [Pomacea canaliculata]|uniref:nuclear factor erythroid 2-related factor 2-like isoform X2 n=1 Tax=Pomacea canaliculata TaxID=400727 RepID=UPI000D73E6BC|nr:nuclear factor erythroid 2-related factor 2-like isoform X2 [Pomacea canaliculata]
MMELDNLIPQSIDPNLSQDLDLIDVLWRQDVDLGVGKEVFDPGLRRELERERELELLKEAEKRKEADKQQQDKQRQAHLWLTQNFMRDGETGEWVPLAGAESSAVFSPSGPQTSTFLETEDHPVFTLDDALEYVNQHNSENQTYSQFATDTQQFQTSLSGENSSFTVTTFPDPPQQDKQIEETCLVNQSQNYSDYSQFNQSDQDRLEQNWQELMQLLNETTFANATVDTTSAASSTASSAMPPVDTQVLLPQTVTSTMNEAHLMQQQHFNINCPQPMTMLQEQDLCTSTSLNESCILPQQQNTPCGENSILMGLLNDTGMLLQNATMPVALNNSSSNIMDHNILAGDLGFANGSTNFGSSATSAESLDWESGEMFFHNVTGLTSLSSVGSSTMLDASDFPEFLPDEDLDIAINEGLTSIQMLDEAESDSAVSMGSTSPLQELNDTVENSPFDGLEGATGGSDYDAHTDGYGQQNGRTHSSSGGSEDDGFHYSCSSYGSPASVHTNCSTNSNDTDHSNSGSSSVTTTSHIHHNHTYPTQPGQTPREVKKYAKKDGLHKKGPISRDQRKAEELKIPITFDTIVESPVEEFNEIMAKHKLTEQQIALIRDIRRRGKNKVAAQNCRKRKLDVIYTLEDEMTELQRMRDKLLAERSHIEEQTRRAKDVYGSLYQHIFSSLRDDHGQPYNPSQYSLQQSSDGNVFLVPRNYSTTTTTAISTSPCSSSSSARGRPASSRNFEGKDKNSSQQKKKNKE